jgi:phosphoglycerate dehydrogenase-like enzyme
MPVLGVRRRMDQPPIPEVDEMHPLDDLESLLPRADVVVLALPATPATRGLLSAARVARLKPGVLLVNIGRGSLVDETALAEALASGRVGGAALDVCAEEPLPREHPFWGHPRVVITPHVAGTDPSHMDRATELFEKNLARFLDGQPLDNLVDKSAGY